jgi:hypothetical protein
MKRPFDQSADTSTQDSEAKRVKMENDSEPPPPPELDTAFLEDGLALLVQNAMAGVENFADHVNDASDAAVHGLPDLTGSTPVLDAPAQVRFSSQPEKYIKNTAIHALGNLVSVKR